MKKLLLLAITGMVLAGPIAYASAGGNPCTKCPKKVCTPACQKNCDKGCCSKKK